MNNLMMEAASLSATVEHILQTVQHHHYCGENLKYHNPSKFRLIYRNQVFEWNITLVQIVI
jgi:hypothetical protein